MTLNLFANLPQHSLKTKKLAKNEILFHQHDDCFAMFYLKSGCIQLTRYTENGDKIVIHHAQQGETFAEAALFSSHYHCDAVAIKDAVVHSIAKNTILNQMNVDPKFAQTLLAHFASQIQIYRRRLELHSIRKAEARIFAAISDGMLDQDISTFAAQIGLTREVTYRALATLVKQHKLQKTARGIYRLA